MTCSIGTNWLWNQKTLPPDAAGIQNGPDESYRPGQAAQVTVVMAGSCGRSRLPC